MSTMKADHPRTIDRYIDFFGDDPGMVRAAVALWVPGEGDPPGVAAAPEESIPDRPER
jgi:hypothetical protein